MARGDVVGPGAMTGIVHTRLRGYGLQGRSRGDDGHRPYGARGNGLRGIAHTGRRGDALILEIVAQGFDGVEGRAALDFGQ